MYVYVFITAISATCDEEKSAYFHRLNE